MSEGTFSYRVVANDIPASGRHFHIEADDEQRLRLAQELGVREIARLSADMEVRPVHGRAFSIRGEVSASVVQTDVVTLEPIPQTVTETIDLTLVPDGTREAGRQRVPTLVDAVEPDIPDVYRHGRIDLGAIVGEHLAIGLDPYPRAPGVEFSGHIEHDPGADPSPFAKLAELKRERE